MDYPLSDARLREMREAAAKASPGSWKVWGMDVLADVKGTSNVYDAEPVAQCATPSTSERRLHTGNATWIAMMDPQAGVALIDEVLRLRNVQPPGTIPLAGLPDEDPRIEAQWQANQTGKTVAFRDATGWVRVEPQRWVVDDDTVEVMPWYVRAFCRGLSRR